MGLVEGMRVTLADDAMHGRLSDVFHSGEFEASHLFYRIPSPFKVVRYHSLIVRDADEISASSTRTSIIVSGITNSNEIMALKVENSSNCPFWGVQFHPESISAEFGSTVMSNFISLARQYVGDRSFFKSEGSSSLCPEPAILSANDIVEVYIKQTEFCAKQINFEALFKQYNLEFSGSDVEFWLDSEYFGKENDFKNSRYSYIGNSTGRHCKTYSFKIKPGPTGGESCYSVLEQRRRGESTVVEKNIDYFSFIQNEFNNFRKTMKINYDVSETEQADIPFTCGFVGFFGYRLRILCGVKGTESNGLKEYHFKPQVNNDDSTVPDAFHLFCDKLIVVDHKCDKIYLVSYFEEDNTWKRRTEQVIKTCMKNEKADTFFNAKAEVPKSSAWFQSEVSDEEYLAQIQKCKQFLKRGESYEICLTRRLFDSSDKAKKLDSFRLFAKLRKLNASPFCYYFNSKVEGSKFQICSTSPERFVKITPTAHSFFLAESKPIKGTIRRSSNPIEDEDLKSQLQNSSKDKSENLMIVDLVRNDFGMFCEKVWVENLFGIESFKTVHQMVSTILGFTRERPLVILRSCFPAGSMTGAPKKRTMELIDGLELSERGIYSGCFGFISLSNHVDTSVVIRTIICTENGVSAGTGGAIVHLSDPVEELNETLLKVEVLKRSLSTL